jgi:PD-(D/E)XK nuclease superfamily
MAIYLYPTIEQTLSCPKRYTLEKVERRDVIAPFMTSELGRQVHGRIAHSLRSNTPVNEREFCLPRRLLLNQGESADTLMTRAYACLEHFNTHCRPWLAEVKVVAVEHKLSSSLSWFGEDIKISGVIDAVVKTSEDTALLLDWKTGGMSGADEQLRWYFALYGMNYPNSALEARAINLFSSETCVVKEFETPQSWLATKVKALLTSFKLVQENKYKAVAGQQCYYCPYAQGCGSSKAKPRVMLDTFDGEVIQVIDEVRYG